MNCFVRRSSSRGPCTWAVQSATTPAPAPSAPAKADHDHDYDHGDHDEPETVAEGLAQLEKLCADVKAHLAAGDHENADGPVHMVGHLPEELGKLVANEKPAVEADAKQGLEAVFESFDKLDTVIHGADEEAVKKLDYAEHAPAIEAALAKLKDLTKSDRRPAGLIPVTEDSMYHHALLAATVGCLLLPGSAHALGLDPAANRQQFVLPADARKLFGIAKGADVVVQGTGVFAATLAIPIIQVTADKVHIRL